MSTISPKTGPSSAASTHHSGLIGRLWTQWQHRRAMQRLDTLDYHILKDMGFRR